MKLTTDILTRGGRDIAFGDYSAAWRFHRKIVHGALCMFGEGSASIEKTSEYTGLLWSHDMAADSFTEESKGTFRSVLPLQKHAVFPLCISTLQCFWFYTPLRFFLPKPTDND